MIVIQFIQYTGAPAKTGAPVHEKGKRIDFDPDSDFDFEETRSQ